MASDFFSLLNSNYLEFSLETGTNFERRLHTDPPKPSHKAVKTQPRLSCKANLNEQMHF